MAVTIVVIITISVKYNLRHGLTTEYVIPLTFSNSHVALTWLWPFGTCLPTVTNIQIDSNCASPAYFESWYERKCRFLIPMQKDNHALIINFCRSSTPQPPLLYPSPCSLPSHVSHATPILISATSSLLPRQSATPTGNRLNHLLFHLPVHHNTKNSPYIFNSIM